MDRIVYALNRPLTVEQVCEVYDRSGIRRPTGDRKRMENMLEHANLIISAWRDARLVGVARAFTDYGWVCYLSDLAVDKAVQKQGIGRELIRRIRQETGPECQLLLLSAPEAMDYYPKIGFEAVANGWIVKRTA